MMSSLSEQVFINDRMDTIWRSIYYYLKFSCKTKYKSLYYYFCLVLTSIHLLLVLILYYKHVKMLLFYIYFS